MLKLPFLTMNDPLDVTNVNYWKKHLTLTAIEDIPMSSYRSYFNSTTARRFDAGFHERSGFWRFTTERLYVLHDALLHLQISECFHTENDNLLYVDLRKILSPLRKKYPGITANPLDMTRATVGFMYIASTAAFANFLSFANTNDYPSEMQLMVNYANAKGSDALGFLPVIFPEDSGTVARYKNNFNFFNGIFDAAPHGQYLAGIDRRNRVPNSSDISLRGEPGFTYKIEGSFNPGLLSYKWDTDPINGLRRVYVSTKPPRKWHPLYLLHLHDKDSIQYYL